MNSQLNLFDDLSLFEGTDVEYKGARGGLPRDLWETYSAFANTEGGTVFLGVTQRPGRLDVHGLENAEKLVSDFWNTLNNRGKVSCNLLLNDDVQILPVEGGIRAVISVHVPRAGRRDRPVYVGVDPFHGTFRRNFEGDYRCTEDEVRRMFADQSEEPADSRILPGFGLQDLHLESLKQFRNRFASRAPDHPWLSEDDLGMLTKLGGWRRDRATGNEGLTLAGLLMFGKVEAITDPQAVPGYHLDYRERLSDDPEVRWTDRLTLDGTWEGNLFQFYQRVMLKLNSDPALKAPFQRDDRGYRQALTPVHEALQEALVNALIHVDYSGQGGIVIDRYRDRFEFSNPGTLLLSLEQLLRGGISECRNKALQKMFQMLGVGDKAGSGLDKIRSSWAAQHWQSPSIQESLRPDRVRLLMPMVSMLPEETLLQLETHFGKRFCRLSRHEVHAVVTAALEGEVTNQRLQEILPLHRVDITKLLQRLVRDRFLISDGVGRGTRYTLDREVSERETVTLPRVSSHSQGISPHNGEISPHSAIYSPHNDTREPGQDTEDLETIAHPIRERRRVKEEEIRETILKLCTRRFLTLQQLAELLKRNPNHLRDRHVTELAREGLLELRYPDKPNHRDQGYRTTEQFQATEEERSDNGEITP